jgi:hypothetical protein
VQNVIIKMSLALFNAWLENLMFYGGKRKLMESDNKVLQVKVKVEMDEISDMCKLLNDCQNAEFDVQSRNVCIDGKDINSWKVLNLKNPLTVRCIVASDGFMEIKNKLRKYLI